MGHRFCQWHQGLCTVLAACLLFCLGPGVETITCKQCHAENDEICRSREETCEESRDGAVCMVGRKYKDNNLIETFMNCAIDDLHCGAELTIPKDAFRLSMACCSDNDLCNNGL